jgi:flagellar assembly protein FliH
LSEWLAAVAGAAPPRPLPGWLAQLDDHGGFHEALPFAAPELVGVHVAEPVPEHVPEPVPESEADPFAEALAKAFAEGEAAGRAAAAAEADIAAARQRALRLAFRRFDEAALAALSDDLAATVIALCEGVLAECAADRTGLLVRCQAAAARIGSAPDALMLYLNPDDLASVPPDALAGWQVAGDPGLEPGAIRIEASDGMVGDGPAEWRRAIAAAVRG